MAEDYPVQDGDCIGSIAFSRGFSWHTIWDHGNNAELKAKRKDPNLLMPGDVVYIPDRRLKQQDCATDQLHKFKVKSVPAKFRVRLLDEDKEEQKTDSKSSSDASYEDPDFKTATRKDKPLADVPYVMDVDGKLIDGASDGDGVIDIPLPPGAQHGKLTLNPGTPKAKTYELKFGGMDPIEEFSGVKRRLNNLGYYCGDGDENAPEFQAALSLFQQEHGLPITGKLDDDTRQAMKDAHGS